MSAAVVPFTGQWQGRFEPSPYQGKAEARAHHDARTLKAAKRENDDWTARLLLALIDTLDSKQRELLEFRLLGQNLTNAGSVQALAIVQLANGNKRHRELVSAAVEGIEAMEAGQ